MKIRPLGNKVIIKVEKEGMTKGGILLPDEAKRKPQKGVVVAVGPGEFRRADVRGYDAARWPIDVKVGDVVLLTRYAGADIEGIEELKDHILADDRDILAVVEPDGIDKAQKK